MPPIECPACQHATLEEPPWKESSGDSLEICPNCKIQFGYDDADYIDRRGDDPVRTAFYRGWGARWRLNTKHRDLSDGGDIPAR